jgi:Fe-S cluster biogenesis protein NfuA
MAKPGAMLETLKTLVVPLIAADGGEVWLVRHGDDEVAIHLTGTCSGCPGATLTARGIIEPAVRTVSKGAKVIVTTGMKIPEGAQRI